MEAVVQPSLIQVMRAGVREWLADERDSMAEFRRRYSEPVEDRWARDGRFMARLYDAGWNRHGWPAEFGGLGGAPILRNVLYDELENGGYRVPDHFVQLETQGPAFMRFAPHLAKKLMPAALRGDEMWAQGFSEPDAGSDLASLRCKAERDGDQWLINGQKTWSSNAVCSQWMSVLVRTGTPESRHRGISLLLVDLRSAGVEVRPLRLANGADEVAEVFFEDARMPAENLIGDENGGWAVAMYLLQFERGNYAWLRQAFVGHRLTELSRQIENPDRLAASWLGDAWLANLALRTRSGATVQRLSAGEAIGPEASIDKILLAQSEQQMNDAYKNLRSARFHFDGDDDAEVWRSDWYYSRATSIYGGAGEIQRDIVADRLLALPKENQ
jgi:alkylation response protein AidB-like acyl-CoA dehydrogenase